MKNAYIGIIIFLLLPMIGNSPGVSADAAASIVYSKYSFEKDQWTNITINPQGYRVSSDIMLYDKLEGDFLFSPWSIIIEKIDEVSFFALNLTQNNPSTVLRVDYLDRTNVVSFTSESIEIESLVILLENVSSRIVGSYNDVSYWGVDLNVVVMESYPELYGVSVTVQRGNDLLTVVYEKESTLIVSDYDIFAQYLVDPNGNISYVAREDFVLNTGGGTNVIQFDTFSVGTDYAPSDLYFIVIFDNGIYLNLYWQSGPLPEVGFSEMNISDLTTMLKDNNTTKSSDLDGKESKELELPFSYKWFFLTLILVPIVRKPNSFN